MGKTYVKTKSRTFLADAEGQIGVMIVGALLAMLSFLVALLMLAVLPNPSFWAVYYRLGLIGFGIIGLYFLIRNEVSRPVMVVVPSVAVLWNVLINFNNNWLAAVVYAAIGVLLFLLFNLISRIYNLYLSLAIMIIISLILIFI